MLTKRQLVVMLLAFLPLMAGAQERRFTIKEAEKLVPVGEIKPECVHASGIYVDAIYVEK